MVPGHWDLRKNWVVLHPGRSRGLYKLYEMNPGNWMKDLFVGELFELVAGC
jgi:hypothetical protein